MSPDGNLPLAGKPILITGAARRVGRVIALAAAQKGAPLALHFGTSKPDAQATRAGCLEAGSPCVTLHQGDLMDESVPERILDEAWSAHGFLWGLVNNASSFCPSSRENADADEWNQLMAVNARAPWQLAVGFASLARAEKRSGRIVNMLDVAVRKTWSNYAAYGASKAALAWVTRSQAKAYAKDGITVNAVSPAATLFPEDMPDAQQTAILRRLPTGTLQPPEDVAAAVLYFLTASASVTGQDLAVDGGALLS